MLLVFASQKIVNKVRNEMAESIVPLRKKIKDSLTRQGMRNIYVYICMCYIKGASIEKDWQKGKKRKEYFLLREHTNKS